MGSRFEEVARDRIESRGNKGTKELYRGDLERWLEHCRKEGVDPDRPTERAATTFRDGLTSQREPGKAVADATKRRILSALSKMYKVAVAKRIATWNPFDVDALDRPKPDEVPATAEYTKAQVDALLSAAEAEGGTLGMRDLAIMRLLYDTGMRITSVTSLRREQLRERGDGTKALLVKVKKKGRVEAELPEASVQAIDRWLTIAPESQWMFPAGRGLGPVTRGALNKRLVVYGERVGVKKAAPHRFRAAYITEAFDAGVPLNEIQAAVHHSDPNSTLRYDRGIRGRGVAAAVAKHREGRK